ncbi:MAG: saccharopine dehydrogenase C-terminal domain-containing protein [Bacteroidia bacterium]
MNILVFGAGRSAFFTIQYLLQNAPKHNWVITVADADVNNIALSTQGFSNAITNIADVHNDEARKQLIAKQQLVISLLPARFHILVAQDCLELGVHLITPSYLTPEIQAMHDEAQAKGLCFVNELGLDPGIDHMSAMQIINNLHSKGAKITGFKSYCGGLVAKEDDTNPWHYKFSWAPYNVIRAGNDGALCRINNSHKYIPYSRLFAETEWFEINGEKFEGYFNRNSERYIDLYNLHSAETFVRGTLRYPDFCRNWNALVNLGATHDSISITNHKGISWQQYFQAFYPTAGNEEKSSLAYILSDKNTSAAIEWLWENTQVEVPKQATPAQALQILLEEKWKLLPDDKDRVIMIHEFIYTIGEKCFGLKSWLDITGENNLETAMAKTVGLPLALAAELIATGQLKATGVIMPTLPELYEPLLARLQAEGIVFREEEWEIS